MIHTERRDSVILLRMEHGKANALDLELCRDLTAAIEAFETSDARAAILTGSGKIFSAGVDLKRIVDGGAEYAAEFMVALDGVLRAVALCSKPLVGAGNGHAIAGGCLLLCACDMSFIAQGKARFGIPELNVGVPVPLVGIEILRSVVPVNYLSQVIYEGATFRAPEAMERGLADYSVPADELMERAFEAATRLAGVPANSFRATKKLLRSPLRERIVSQKEVEEEARAAWGETETLEAVAEFVRTQLG
ncbi:MAG: enoyl-CoA hydratase/isomerase family protein [Planctomycetota bacterium]